jgi:hypothetical protein
MFKISNQTKIALDIQDLSNEVILDSLLERGGEVFRTSRKRKAILIGQAAINDLKKKFSLNIDEGPDGTGILKD